MTRTPVAALTFFVFVAFVTVSRVAAASTAVPIYRVDHVVDGDTIALRNGQRVRLVQIDTPEGGFGTEGFCPQTAATTKRPLSPRARGGRFPGPAPRPGR